MQNVLVLQKLIISYTNLASSVRAKSAKSLNAQLLKRFVQKEDLFYSEQMHKAQNFTKSSLRS